MQLHLACVVLHIICEQDSDTCRPKWMHTDSAASIPGTPAVTATGVGGNAINIHNALQQCMYENQ